MPRAKRIFIPGGVWHLTHRCHNREFLLKFERDRSRWRYWLYEACRRYRLSVLNFIATSNHVHLLVWNTPCSNVSSGMQLIASRVAQEYNQRKSRRGAFWEDRYFATAVATDNHLTRCLVYIDLNMVRACAVKHPSEWKVSGFNEIQSPRSRYRIIDFEALCQLTNSNSPEAFRQKHRSWVEEQLNLGNTDRQPEWTEAVVVGPEPFKRQYEAEKSRLSRALAS